MEKYQCCTNMFAYLSFIPGIENRVYLRKKLDLINVLKKNQFSKQFIAQLTETIDSCTASIPKFRKIEGKISLNSMITFSYEF